MGQGQAPRATKLISDSLLQGNWVIIENCHVDESWLGKLEVICLKLAVSENVNEDFRLWLTSNPTSKFPIMVLQMALKLTTESPTSLKANMMHSYATEPWLEESDGNEFTDDLIWNRSVFALVFFHAVVKERVAFGPIGWNVPYEFNDMDLMMSIEQMKIFMIQCGAIPMDGHFYLIGECNYGGRVTDARDRLLMAILLKAIYNEEAVSQDCLDLDQFGNIRVPANPTKENCTEYISKLAIDSSPRLVGLDENCGFGKSCHEVEQVGGLTLISMIVRILLH